MSGAAMAVFEETRAFRQDHDSDWLYTDHEQFEVVCGSFLWRRAILVGEFVAGRAGGGGPGGSAIKLRLTILIFWVAVFEVIAYKAYIPP